MTNAKRWTPLKLAVLGIGALFLLGIGAALISFMLLDSKWLRVELERQAGSSLQAEVGIGALEFSPWSGRVAMADFSLKRDREGDKLDAQMKQAEAEVDVFGLLFRRLTIKKLHLHQPTIKIEETRDPEPDAKPTMERLKEAGQDLLSGSLSKKSGSAKENKSSKGLEEIHIGELKIENGAIHYTAHREGVEPFVAQLDALDYLARDVSPHTLHRLLMDCTLKSGATVGTKADLEYQSNSEGATFHLNGLDVGYADRYLSQKDAVVFQAGTLHITRDPKSGAGIKVRIEGLKLARNMNAPTDEFYFIPVDKLVEYVNSKGGNLELEFKDEKGSFGASEDLEAVILQFWDGLAIALVDEVKKSMTQGAADKAKSLLDKGRDLIRKAPNKDEVEK